MKDDYQVETLEITVPVVTLSADLLFVYLDSGSKLLKKSFSPFAHALMLLANLPDSELLRSKRNFSTKSDQNVMATIKKVFTKAATQLI